MGVSEADYLKTSILGYNGIEVMYIVVSGFDG